MHAGGGGRRHKTTAGSTSCSLDTNPCGTTIGDEQGGGSERPAWVRTPHVGSGAAADRHCTAHTRLERADTGSPGSQITPIQVLSLTLLSSPTPLQVPAHALLPRHTRLQPSHCCCPSKTEPRCCSARLRSQPERGHAHRILTTKGAQRAVGAKPRRTEEVNSDMLQTLQRSDRQCDSFGILTPSDCIQQETGATWQ
eukprot:1344719-Rhodomonas_salina.2